MVDQQRNPGPQLFYRLGLTREQHLFDQYRDHYFGLCIRANYVAYFQKFTVGLLLNLNKPFFIDPITYIFSRDPTHVLNSDGNIKKSFEYLQEYFGDPIRGNLGVRPLEPGDFRDSNLLHEFVARVINFQIEGSVELPEKYQRYERFVGAANLNPLFVIPPYFFIEDATDPWLDINLEMATSALEHTEKPVFPVIFISRQIAMNHDDVTEISDRFMNSDFPGYIVWIEKTHGVRSDSEVLQGYRSLIQNIATHDKPIISLYGDYFSVLLSYDGLWGLTAGICYSEAKEVDPAPIEGAIPDRYYTRNFRCKYQIETTIARADISNYPDLICNCGICPKDMDIIGFDRETSQKHFLLVRSAEVDEVHQRSRNEILDEMNQIYDQYRDHALFNPDHLNKWIRILE